VAKLWPGRREERVGTHLKSPRSLSTVVGSRTGGGSEHAPHHKDAPAPLTTVRARRQAPHLRSLTPAQPAARPDAYASRGCGPGLPSSSDPEAELLTRGGTSIGACAREAGHALGTHMRRGLTKAADKPGRTQAGVRPRARLRRGLPTLPGLET
jgi:hypothetical protein